MKRIVIIFWLWFFIGELLIKIPVQAPEWMSACLSAFKNLGMFYIGFAVCFRILDKQLTGADRHYLVYALSSQIIRLVIWVMHIAFQVYIQYICAVVMFCVVLTCFIERPRFIRRIQVFSMRVYNSL